ncbi:translation initiation factor IF-2-like [Schistocerca piceifrons]|uniref:translation initiation factor IF-2-like n=1 Tax=Schistocerca piceifrons TaxID=274613 RepID=UPI001F5E8E84|nr:translation initiation factor IF-2-like [Schistocerca piceifrons]XP_049814747.1 translation initiation factor IF-2-like [Schistocerca nitens]
MKVALVLSCALAVCSAGLLAGPAALVRTPSLDSAVIQSDRLGGNFAYSAVEGHAYAAVSPVVQNVVRPVAVSYTAHQVPVGHAVLPAVAPAHLSFVHSPAVIPGSGLIFAGAPVAAAPASDSASASAPAPAAPAPSSDAAVSSDDTVSVEAA